MVRRVLVIVVALLAGCSSAPSEPNRSSGGQPPSVALQAVQVPLTAWPSDLVIAPNTRVVWVAEQGAVAEIDVHGDVRQHMKIGADRLIQGPNGSRCFSADRGIGRIDDAGEVDFFPLPSVGRTTLSWLDPLAAGEDGALWATHEGVKGD